MKKVELKLRKSALVSVGKLLTMCGVALTFAACYGVPPEQPDFNKQQAEHLLYGEPNESDQTEVTPLETDDTENL